VSPELVGGIDGGVVIWLLLAVLPLALVACTAFTKLSIVLAALRVGLGAEALLPAGLMLALALVLSVVAMGPTGVEVVEALRAAGGLDTLMGSGTGFTWGPWFQAFAPLTDFMRAHVHPEELEFFGGLSHLPAMDPRVLVPAFMVSELSEALSLCVLLLVPFVLIDVVVAQVLMLLELSNVQVRSIALPLKLLLFLTAGGWDLLIGSVVEGYLA
jgi:flagellar biosynthesis protein FliP